MGARLGHLAVLTVLLLGGCSHHATSPADPASAHSAGVSTGQPAAPSTGLTAIPEPTSAAPPYTDADREIREVAEGFVHAALEYDTTTEEAATFLSRVAPLVTQDELDRLRRSPRARLDWRVLRDRAERVEVSVTGITQATVLSATPSTEGVVRVLVEAERTTQTSFATVRDFLHLTLRLVVEGGRLKVAAAGGGGL